MGEYWNHNTVFHDGLVAAAASRSAARVLDVGCGDGLLIQRLAPLASEVVGIDTDPSAVLRAQDRLSRQSAARVLVGDVMIDDRLADETFDVITCVATLHHLPLADALRRFERLLRPGGLLLVIGLSANKSRLDWIISGAQVIPLRVIGRLRHEARDIGVATAVPRESLAEIGAVAVQVLPGARIRRRFYYRYSLTWRKPI